MKNEVKKNEEALVGNSNSTESHLSDLNSLCLRSAWEMSVTRSNIPSLFN